jgi:hypothetical protein
MNALQTLLTGVVDYAGLFPPAALPIAQAVAGYEAYAAGEHAWMLGRFVVPAARLGDVPNGGLAPSRLAILLGDEWARDLASAPAAADFFELRASDRAELARVRAALDASGRESARAFVEIPWTADAAALADAARAARVGLKLRTGGVTPDAFPSPDVVLAFLHACVARRVACKLTAGLHHPLRAEHPLTYEAGCARGTMYGFLNVLVASALLAAGHAPQRVAPVLEERDASAFTFGDDVVIGGMQARAAHLAVEGRCLRSFGSCSFAEPVADLRALALLPSSPATAVTSATI